MARDILSSTASSVPVERLFSTGTLIISKNKNKLESKSLRALMCIHSWVKSPLMSRICDFHF